MHGDVPVIAAALHGLKAVAIALIVQALLRIGGRALREPLHVVLAAAALALMLGRVLPFPLIVAVRGARRRSRRPAPGCGRAVHGRAGPLPLADAGHGHFAVARARACRGRARGRRVACTSRCTVSSRRRRSSPSAAPTRSSPGSTSRSVEVYGWLTQADTVAGLALAETTPGPLIIVLQFVGFMTGWNHAGPAGPAFTATATALLTSWAVFLPAVVLMLVGAPYVEKVTANARLGAALDGLTAAVVGVIASLAVAFGGSVLFPAGLGQPDAGGAGHRGAGLRGAHLDADRRASGSSRAASSAGLAFGFA